MNEIRIICDNARGHAKKHPVVLVTSFSPPVDERGWFEMLWRKDHPDPWSFSNAAGHTRLSTWDQATGLYQIFCGYCLQNVQRSHNSTRIPLKQEHLNVVMDGLRNAEISTVTLTQLAAIVGRSGFDSLPSG